MRLFYAIKIPGEIRDAVFDYGMNYKDIEGIRVIDRSLYHITLLFLGETDISEAENLDKLAQNLANNDFNTRIDINQAGVFPNNIMPSIIWVGTREKNEKLVSLSKSIKSMYIKYMMDKKRNNFKAHITVCRIKKKHKHLDIAEFNRSLPFEINGFSLFESKLTPEGPIYNELNSYKFIRSTNDGRQ